MKINKNAMKSNEMHTGGGGYHIISFLAGNCNLSSLTKSCVTYKLRPGCRRGNFARGRCLGELSFTERFTGAPVALLGRSLLSLVLLGSHFVSRWSLRCL